MVHLRLNETETNPNPHINFITALPGGPGQQEESRQLLRALAAQVRPVMKSHGFVVNSFEEYEYNNVFAGRNWNNGETVELVLRRADGAFYPIYWLMGTLCHELAHIKHMNHGPDFQKLWSRLKAEVRQLQDKGYYGDGYWSSGTRLRDSTRVGGQGIEDGDFPEYLCGGAQTKTRPTARRRRQGGPRGKRRELQPSLHTGAQTAKKRKSGARVTSKYAFTGEGASLAAEGNAVGTGFGKKAASKRARDERALAAEKRLQALSGSKDGVDTKPTAQQGSSVGDRENIPDVDEDDDDDEVEFVPETDAERRQALLASEHVYASAGSSNSSALSGGAKGLPSSKLGSGAAWKSMQDDFNFSAPSAASGSGASGGSSRVKEKAKANSQPKPGGGDIIEIFSSDEQDEPEDDKGSDEPCDLPVASGSTFTTHPRPTSPSPPSSKRSLRASAGLGLGLGLGKMVQTEMDLRRKEALGMAPLKGGGRTLGAGPGPGKASTTKGSLLLEEGGRGLRRPTHGKKGGDSEGPWSCLVCTLENEPSRSSCAACTTPKGQDTFPSTVS